jgi:hypothetical protein
VKPERPRGIDALAGLACTEAGIDVAGGNAVVSQQPHLILHQRDQRRDHDHDAGPQQRRQLVAQGLAATGRHHRQQIAAGEGVEHHRLLTGPETIEAEAVPKRGQNGLVSGGGRHGKGYGLAHRRDYAGRRGAARPARLWAAD